MLGASTSRVWVVALRPGVQGIGADELVSNGSQSLITAAVAGETLDSGWGATRLWVAEAFARLPALVGSRHVVDVGGGHGVLMIALQRRHPTLRGTVFWLRQV
jgi:hypothetical protein